MAEGVYDDAYGRAATVKVGRVQREQRFPPGHPLDLCKAWRTKTKADLTEEQPIGAVIVRGTLAADALRYLKQVAGKPGSAADASHLQAWIDRFGPTLRSRLSPGDVRTALAEWRTDGLHYGGRGTRHRQATGQPASEKTLQQRWRVLRHLYKTLDGPKAKTPCDGVERPRPSASTPVGVEVAVIQRVATKFSKWTKGTALHSEARKNHARFLMLTTTGQRPAQVMRAVAEDFRLREQFWIVRGAKGGPTHAIYLNADMRAAVKLFLHAKAFGPYNDKQLLALARRAGWPKHVRLYNARHSLAIDAIARGADLGDIQAMLGHASIETTRKFYGGILRMRQKGVGRSLEGRLRTG